MKSLNQRMKEFQGLGFKCLDPVQLVFRDGSKVRVKAHSYMDSRENLVSSPAQRAALRLYSVTRYDRAGVSLISELELIRHIGEDVFGELN